MDTASFVCARCILTVPGEPAFLTHRGNPICTACTPHYASCDHCDETFRNCDLSDRGNFRLCYSCRSYYTYCDNCNDCYLAADGEDGLCASCVDECFVCEDCGSRFSNEQMYGDNLCRDCHRSGSGLYRRAIRAGIDGTPSVLFPTRRTIGVELEMLVPDNMDGDDIPTMWGSTKEDGSLDPHWGEYGVEFASIPVSGSAISEMLTAACAAFSDARVDPSCGMHVHIDVSDLTDSQRLNIVRWWQHTEDVWFGLVNDERDGNSYCKRIRGLDPARLASDRYRALNTDAFYKHGTFELRLHHGTTNKQEIETFCATALNFVEMAKDLPLPDAADSQYDLFMEYFAPPTLSDKLKDALAGLF